MGSSPVTRSAKAEQQATVGGGLFRLLAVLLLSMSRQLHFNAFIWPNGYHEAAWRVVDDDARDVLGLSYYADIARIAERGLMDSIFLADHIAIAGYRASEFSRAE